MRQLIINIPIPVLQRTRYARVYIICTMHCGGSKGRFCKAQSGLRHVKVTVLQSTIFVHNNNICLQFALLEKK